MSRVEQKKLKKRKSYRVSMLIFLIVLFLFVGIVITDNALKQMMALEEEGPVLGYERQEHYHLINLLGRTFYIDQRVIDKRTKEAGLWLKESYDYIRKSIAN